jgi:CRISPR-associated protein Cmr4
MNFLLETATEITARIRLEEESKTVSAGALWYEEALPAESVLSGLGVITPRPRINGRNGQTELSGDEIGEALEHIANKHLQLGGKSTVGRGQCRVRVFKGA